jgi:hypothetical protein
MRGCQEKKSFCAVVNPELMHRCEPRKGRWYVTDVAQGNGKCISAPDESFERIRGATKNIVNSARCKALFNQQCLPPRRKPKSASDPSLKKLMNRPETTVDLISETSNTIAKELFTSFNRIYGNENEYREEE